MVCSRIYQISIISLACLPTIAASSTLPTVSTPTSCSVKYVPGLNGFTDRCATSLVCSVNDARMRRGVKGGRIAGINRNWQAIDNYRM
jgi:hypothetical protein